MLAEPASGKLDCNSDSVSHGELEGLRAVCFAASQASRSGRFEEKVSTSPAGKMIWTPPNSPAEVLKRYQAAATIDDEYAELEFRMARTEWKLGECKSAKEHFLRGRDLDTSGFVRTARSTRSIGRWRVQREWRSSTLMKFFPMLLQTASSAAIRSKNMCT
jgi:hypothetical protein